MIRFQERGLSCNFCLAVLFGALLTAGSGAAAQTQEIVYSLSANDGWPKSTRADGKLTAVSFTFGAQLVGTTPATVKPEAQDVVLTIPVGEPVPLWLRAAVSGRHLNFVLIEFSPAGQKAPRAPFAVRLSDVMVTSVQVSKSRGDGGPGMADVKLKYRTFEVFTATQDAAGAMKPGAQYGWDFAKQSPL